MSDFMFRLGVPQLPGVYFIRCDATLRSYVGSSVTMRKRVLATMRVLRSGRHPYGSTSDMQADFARYGSASFVAGVLQCARPDDDLVALEQYWIDVIGSRARGGLSYNASPIAKRVPAERLPRGPRKRVLVPGKLLSDASFSFGGLTQ